MQKTSLVLKRERQMDPDITEDALYLEKFPAFYLEKAISDTFSGLHMFVRDVSLTPEVADLYEPGTVILERAFVDATDRFMGIPTTHRITILSNRMFNISRISNDPKAMNWGLSIAPAGSRFKVLDVYPFGDKTQILLLHLPMDERWRLFEHMEEEDFLTQSITSVRKLFEEQCGQPVIPELAEDEWLKRLTFPVGFDDNLEPWPVEIPAGKRFAPVRDISFRQLENNVYYFRGIASSETVPADALGDAEDALGYIYIDPESGLKVKLLKAASLSGDLIEALPNDDIEYLDPFDLEVFGEVEAAQVVDNTLADCTYVIDSLHEVNAPSEGELSFREMVFLDPFRKTFSPDELEVTLITDADPEFREKVSVRPRHLSRTTIYASLENEPSVDAGVHKNDLVPLLFNEKKDGLECFALADSAIRQSQE
ncbi:MAG: hypothetical protein LUB61_01440 [Eggerthellaceae bacterium]|nr:hypothetical protein [Eggerthellaceae bacterium]